MAITPGAGYMVDPTNSNGVVPIGSTSNTSSLSSAPNATDSSGNSVYVGNPALNPQFNYNTPTTPSPNPTPSVSSSILNPPPITPLQQPATTNPQSTNASVPNPTQIINDANAPTASDNQQQDLLTQIANLTANDSSLATKQSQQETAAGVPALTGTVNDLSTQLQGLNDQATALQNEAQYTIPNAAQVSAEGRGITAGGLAPVTASQLRMNQIKQGAIATQSLTVKSALYAAMGKYSLAKDAADKAAQVAFDAQTQQLAAAKANLDALAPTLTREESARKDFITAQLQDRANQIQTQKENANTGHAAIVEAMKNNPNDPNAQYAAQQALKLDPTDPQYLDKVTALVGKYSSDVAQNALQLQATKLDIQLKQAQIKALANSLPAKQQAAVDKATTALDNSAVGKTLPQVASAYGNMLQMASDPTILTDPAKQKTLLVNFAQVMQPGGMGLRALLGQMNASQFEPGVYDALKNVQAVFDAGGQAKLSQDAINGILDSATGVYNSNASTYADMRNQSLKILQNEGVQNPEQYLSDYSKVGVNGTGKILMVGPDGKNWAVPASNIPAFVQAGGSFPISRYKRIGSAGQAL